MEEKIQKKDAEWKEQLTPNQYHVTRQKGTEPPFTGVYEDEDTPGTCLLYTSGEGGRRAAENGEGIRAGDDRAKPQACQSGGLREGAGHEELRIFLDPRNDGYAREFGVGFIDHHSGVRCRLQNRFDRFRGNQRAGWIVGIANEYGARTVSYTHLDVYKRQLVDGHAYRGVHADFL